MADLKGEGGGIRGIIIIISSKALVAVDSAPPRTNMWYPHRRWSNATFTLSLSTFLLFSGFAVHIHSPSSQLSISHHNSLFHALQHSCMGLSCPVTRVTYGQEHARGDRSVPLYKVTRLCLPISNTPVSQFESDGKRKCNKELQFRWPDRRMFEAGPAIRRGIDEALLDQSARESAPRTIKPVCKHPRASGRSGEFKNAA